MFADKDNYEYYAHYYHMRDRICAKKKSRYCKSSSCRRTTYDADTNVQTKRW